MIKPSLCTRFLKKLMQYKNFSAFNFPDIDTDYYCDKRNTTEITQNIKSRKGVGDIAKALEIYNIYKTTPTPAEAYGDIKRDLYKELACLPNRTHPVVQSYDDTPHIVHEINEKKSFGDYKPLEFSDITQLLNLMRTDKLGHTCGNKSYYYFGELAEYEEALIKYTVCTLLKDNFRLVSVPDILSGNILQSCGMMINTDRTQVRI